MKKERNLYKKKHKQISPSMLFVHGNYLLNGFITKFLVCLFGVDVLLPFNKN